MRSRRLLIAALAALVGLGCWWALRSAPTSAPRDPAVAENPRDVEDRREAAERKRAERTARQDRADQTTDADAAAGVTLLVHVVVRGKGDPVAGARVVAVDDDSRPHEATTDAVGIARIEQFGGDYARITTTASGFTRGSFFATKDELRADAPIVVEVDPAGTLEGVVRDAGSGGGIAGAKVEESTGHDIAAVTAADGSFRLDGVPVVRGHTVTLRATEPRHFTTTVGWSPADGARVEIRMAAAGRISGRVADPTGAPAPWATVTARWQGKDSFGTDSVQADADGRFEVGGLRLGREWRLVASKPTFSDSVPSDDVLLEAGRAEATCDLALQRPAHLVVRVTRPDDAPADGAKIRLFVGDVAIERRADGACDIEVLTPGACALAVEAPGLAARVLEVELAPGERRELGVRLETGATFAGLVVDDLGAPLAGAQVWEQHPRVRGAALWPHSTTTAADGSFRLEGLAPGDVAIDVSGVEGHESVSHVQATAPATDARFVLRRDGAVVFRLLRPPGGEAMSNIVVRVVSSSKWLSIPWSDDVVRMPLAAGKWTIAISVGECLTESRVVDVAPGADTSLGEIALDLGLTIEGRVVDAHGRPIKDAVVRPVGGGPVDPDALGGAIHGAGRGGRSGAGGLGLTDAAGAFRLQHLAPGTTTFSASAADFLATSATYDVADGCAPLLITLRRGGVLRGVVLDADGKPVGGYGVLIHLVIGDDSADVSYVPVVDGAFFQRVEDGRAHLVVHRGEATLATRDVDVREGEETSVKITLER